MMVVSSQRSDHATGSVWTRRTEAALARGHKQGPQRRTAGERRRAARQWQARSVFLLSELQRRGARFRSAPFVWAHDPKSPKTWHGAARAGASSESRSLFQPVVPWADRTACSHSSIFFPSPKCYASRQTSAGLASELTRRPSSEHDLLEDTTVICEARRHCATRRHHIVH